MYGVHETQDRVLSSRTADPELSWASPRAANESSVYGMAFNAYRLYIYSQGTAVSPRILYVLYSQ
jgi:hypothetical protein